VAAPQGQAYHGRRRLGRARATRRPRPMRRSRAPRWRCGRRVGAEPRRRCRSGRGADPRRERLATLPARARVWPAAPPNSASLVSFSSRCRRSRRNCGCKAEEARDWAELPLDAISTILRTTRSRSSWGPAWLPFLWQCEAFWAE